MFLLLLLCFSLISLAFYLAQFCHAAETIGQLTSPVEEGSCQKSSWEWASVSVIVPAYNEADNIQACVTSILNSTEASSPDLEVWAVDDQSTDATWTILKTLQEQLQDPRLHLLAGVSRPKDETWTGKNWACTQAAAQATGEFLLFIDADVRLKPGAIAAAVRAAQKSDASLLNCIPEVVCESVVEYLVQPLIFISMVISFAQPAIRNPDREVAYAAGPFMLFERSAYQKIGGHRAVAAEVAEDVALARAVKRHQLNLQHRLGAHLASLRMYTSWTALWEGWTKVLYVGAWRNAGLMVLLVVVMLSLYTVPWLGLGILLAKGWTGGWNRVDGWSIGLILASFALQYYLRRQLAHYLLCPPRYWWLQGMGGLLIAIMAIASIIKAETGWGWTWRGRSLKA